MSTVSIGYRVPLIPQSTGASCWAAGMAMILAWRNHTTVDPVLLATNAGGKSFLKDFEKLGVDLNDPTILRRWGFVTEPPMSYMPDAFGEMLQRFGPLWVASAVPGVHIRVVTGFEPGSDPDGFSDAVVHINDPWERGMKTFRPGNRGSQYSMSYVDFSQQVANLGAITNKNRDPSPMFVAHLP